MEDIRIIDNLIGAGSGGKAGEARPAKEAPNTLRSRATIRILDVVCEGEVQGLATGDGRSIFIDGTPLQNDDLQFNFENTSYDIRVGSVIQTPMPGFPNVESEVSVTTQVTNGTPVVRQTSNTATDAARVKIQLPEGMYSQDNSNGDLNPFNVTIAIDTRELGGVFQEVVNKTIEGKTTNPNYVAAFRVERPAAAAGALWEIRVRRISPDDPNSSKKSRTDWISFTEIQDHQLPYNDTAYIGTITDAQVTGNRISKRQFLMRLIKVLVPTNYNPLTKIYTGVWDGTFKREWTDNPAWHCYDMLTNERYGIGEFVKPADVDKFSFYNASVYNDELIDDGQGGTEPRYTFSYQFMKQDSAWKMIQSIAGAMRATVVPMGELITLVQDRPRNSVKKLSNSEIIGGFVTRAGTALAERHTSVNVTFSDKTNNYLPRTLSVIDNTAVLRFGFNETDIVSLGATTESQALRFGRWVLETELNNNIWYTFSVPMMHADIAPGEIIDLVDNENAQFNGGGLVRKASTDSNIFLDQYVNDKDGESYNLSLLLSDATSYETQPINLFHHEAQNRNIIRPEYSRFNDLDGLPLLTAVNGTFSQIDNVGKVSNQVVELDASTVNSRLYMGSNTSDYNMDLTSSTRWLMSAWVFPVGNNANIELGVATVNGVTTNGFTSNTPADTWTRVSFVIDMTSDASNKGIALVGANVADDKVYFDGIQLEAMPTGSTPTDYIEPQMLTDVFTNVFSEPATTSYTWQVDSGANVEQVEIIGIVEQAPGEYQVSGINYDPLKYDRVETGYSVDAPIFDTNTTDTIGPVSDVVFAEESRSIANDIINTTKRRLRVDWSPPADTSLLSHYRVIHRRDGGTFTRETIVNNTEFIIEDVQFGTYQVIVYAVGIQNTVSPGVSATHVLSASGASAVSPPTGLQVKGGGTIFASRALTFEWTSSINPDIGDVIGGYQIEIKKTDDTLLNTFVVTPDAVEFTYLFEDNNNDNSGDPQRDLKIELRVIDTFGRLSAPTTATFTNPPPPAPDISVAGNIKELWVDVISTPPTDSDFTGYIYAMSTTLGFTPQPSDIVQQGNITNTIQRDLIGNTTYYVKVATTDTFGYVNLTDLNFSSEGIAQVVGDLKIFSFASNGIFFKENDPVANSISWTAGVIAVDDGATTTSYPIAAGSAPWTAGSLFIYYVVGDGILKSTTSIITALAGGVSKVYAIYKGGIDITDANGVVAFDGANIIAETIGATQVVTSGLITNSAQINTAIINNGHIQDLAVTNAKIANATISGAKIGLATITNANIAEATIAGTKFVNGTITTNKIGANQITSALIAANQITVSELANGSVTSAIIADGNVGTNELATNAVTGVKVASLAISNTKIANTTITGGKIATGTITTNNLAANTIVAGDISANTITANELIIGAATSQNATSNTGSQNFDTTWVTAASVTINTIGRPVEVNTAAIVAHQSFSTVRSYYDIRVVRGSTVLFQAFNQLMPQGTGSITSSVDFARTVSDTPPSGSATYSLQVQESPGNWSPMKTSYRTIIAKELRR